MIIDTSAIVAMLRAEADSGCIEDAFLAQTPRRLSAGSLIELNVVLQRSGKSGLLPIRDALFARYNVVVEPVTVEQARIAQEGYRKFGQASGSKAHLNFGDCFAYALAKETGEPLLFKGHDFIHTDIASAV